MGPPKTSELERLLRQAPVAPPAVLVYLAARIGAALRRSAHARAGVAFGLAMVLGIGYIGSSAGTTPTATATVPQPILPLTQAAFATAVSTNRALTEPATIRFSAPMDRASVAASITLDPPTPVTLAWDDSGTVLTVAPRDHWAAGTFQTVTVESGALALSGQPLARPVRSVFLTRDATTASAVATQPAGDRVAVGTAFVVTFARPVEAGSLAGAVRLDPPTLGTIDEVTTQAGVTGLAFLPMRALLPDVAYRLSVVGVRDTDGLPLDPVVLMVHTAKAPTVVRFRPHAGTGGIARDATMSVRFSMPMDRTSTAHAFTVSSHGKAIAGTVAWAEHDTVLLFTPKAALPRASSVSMAVGLDATAVGGAPLAVAGHATFRTIGSGAPGTTGTAGSPSVPISAGSAVGGGSWASVETYYLGLMNCTRTGGWVTSSGACSSPGGRNVAPLKLDTGISSKVSRPYARMMAIDNACSHFIGGNPGTRLRAAGYASYRWAENIGCRSGSARAAVLATHLFYQSEKSYGGGHYVNLMNPAYNRVGIGVWVSGGRVRLVIDFYHS
jgi:uncharacterized protein YkwD